MNKLFVPLAILLILAFIITGCSTASTSTPRATASTSTPPVTTGPSTTIPSNTTSAVTPAGPTTSTASTPASSATPEYGGTLIDVEAGPPGSPFGWPPEIFGPAGITSQISLQQLLNEDRNGNFLPNLATSYDVVTDPANASITFHLRKGVKFQDGTDFNAQAVKWNMDMVKNSKMDLGITSAWKSINVLDDYTVKVDLTTWQNIIIRNFTGIATLFVSPTAYQKNGVDWMRTHMVGTGPFEQVSYNTDVALTTKKFADYWDTGKPYLDGLNIEYVVDPLTRLALFKSGGADVMAVDPKDAASLQQDGYNIINYPAAANVLIPDSANADSPWSNVDVRKAAEYAIDKPALSKAFGYGFNPPAYQLAPEQSQAIDSSITGRQYDPTKAKQLLTEAGYPNGFKTSIFALNTTDTSTAIAIQAYLKAIGIQASLDLTSPARWATLITGTWQNGLLLGQLRPFPNFNADLTLEFGSPFTVFYKSVKKPDGWQQTLDATLNSPQPDPKLMQAATQALYNDCTMIPLTYYASLYVTQPYVHDTGRGKMGSQTEFTPQDAWLSK